jgi:hypothetical protein
MSGTSCLMSTRPTDSGVSARAVGAPSDGVCAAPGRGEAHAVHSSAIASNANAAPGAARKCFALEMARVVLPGRSAGIRAGAAVPA